MQKTLIPVDRKLRDAENIFQDHFKSCLDNILSP